MRLGRFTGAAVVLAAAVSFGSAAFAEETEVLTEAPAMEAEMETGTEAGTEVKEAGAEAESEAAAAAGETELELEGGAGGAAALSDDWTDYQIQMDDVVYQFPMSYADFTAAGWTMDEDDGMELQPNQYTSVRFLKDEIKVYAYVINFGINNMAVEECLIGGISMDDYDWPVEQGTVTLAGGIVRGVADVDAITAAYGTPSDTYEGDMYTKLTYETGSYCEIELEISSDSGVLEDITIRNFVEPEDFDAGEASTEVPEAVAAYQKPETLSDDVNAYEIEMDGEIYALPVPVSVLAADGWEIVPENTDEVISANYYGWVELRKGGQSFRTTAVNEEDYATIPENCWIEELEVGGFTLEVDGALPGGIRIGITDEELQTIIGDTGVQCEVNEEEGSTFKYYTLHGEEYGKEAEVMVYTADDGMFPANTVVRVSLSNEFD